MKARQQYFLPSVELGQFSNLRLSVGKIVFFSDTVLFSGMSATPRNRKRTKALSGHLQSDFTRKLVNLTIVLNTTRTLYHIT